jgi:nucleotide-binding universal stress UspA family protein
MTDYKTILVHLDAGRGVARRLESAIGVARLFDAHLACLFALDTVPEPSASYEARRIVLEAQQRGREDMLDAARRTFDDCVRRTGYGKVEWRATAAYTLGAVALHARYADLVVIGQQEADAPSGVGKAFERDLPLAAGRPVLVVPYAFEQRGVGERILVAWNASREAARAVTDALPLLRRARHVHLVTVNASASARGHGEEPGADIGLFLTRHGVKVTVAPMDSTVEVGAFLLSRAFDVQADMIVAGAWGHSRLREAALGGVTRTLLASMTVPVLLSH